MRISLSNYILNMGYLIELSVNLNKASNITEIKYNIVDKAKECRMENYHELYEFMGKNRNSYRHHFVLTLNFFYIN